MKDRTIILIAGYPACGKTTLGTWLGKALGLVFLSRDSVKQALWDELRYDTACREETVRYRGLSYAMAVHVCRLLMQTGQSFLFESNFTPQWEEPVEELLNRYGYRAVTVFCQAPLEVAHRRFVERDGQAERHPGLVARGYFDSFEVFRKEVEPVGAFQAQGPRLEVDMSDFSKASFEEIRAWLLEQ